MRHSWVLRNRQGRREGQIDEGAQVDNTANVWHLAHIRSAAVVGAETIIGRAAYVGSGVVVGRRCKVQNLAQIFEPAVLEDGVFVGPGAILTNDRRPRAVNPDGSLKSTSDWQPVGVFVETGASIGAGAICVAPIRVGRWAMIAAGAVLVSSTWGHQHARLVGLVQLVTVSWRVGKTVFVVRALVKASC